MMQKLWTKICSMILVIVMVVNMLPMTVWAEEYQQMSSTMVIISFTVLVTIPFAKDFFDKNIVVAQGVYCNVLGSEKKSSSSLMGIYSVTLENKDGMIKLTTAPWRNDVFVIGEYNVTAYYLPASKTLLHIEINI